MLPLQHLLTLLLVCNIYAALPVDGQKIKRAPKWKPNSRPYNGDKKIATTSGSDIRMSCPAYGYPKPIVIWYKEDSLFGASQRPKTKIRRFSLDFNDVQTSDSGKYKCVVQNSEGSLEFTFFVDVKPIPWPLELEEPLNATVMEGERVVFRCRALNDPDATTEWMKRDTDGDSASGFDTNNFLSSGPEMVIENARTEDAGKYTCLVGNLFGIKYANVWLTVRHTTTTSSASTNPTNKKSKTTTLTTTEQPTTSSPVISYSFLTGNFTKKNQTDRNTSLACQSLLKINEEKVNLQKRTVDILEEMLIIQKQKLTLLQKSLTC
ncbi:fibroblast growth factor receptor 4-like [Saccostrea echinata]|uniref:fibroblast growth factor receptor 4-like n=1 Tax=Saccostrea echinata TaxID=191078 RepID=UPI002A82AD8D|nr:fibroblast growth factor receptor 4-like [Saccostrea echinata]